MFAFFFFEQIYILIRRTAVRDACTSRCYRNPVKGPPELLYSHDHHSAVIMLLYSHKAVTFASVLFDLECVWVCSCCSQPKILVCRCILQHFSSQFSGVFIISTADNSFGLLVLISAVRKKKFFENLMNCRCL